MRDYQTEYDELELTAFEYISTNMTDEELKPILTRIWRQEKTIVRAAIKDGVEIDLEACIKKSVGAS